MGQVGFQPPQVSGNLGAALILLTFPSPAGTTHMAPVPSLTWEGGLCVNYSSWTVAGHPGIFAYSSALDFCELPFSCP